MTIKSLYNTLKSATINVRGMELSITTIIVLVLSLLVLVVLATFFIGGSQSTLNPLADLAKESGGNLNDAFN